MDIERTWWFRVGVSIAGVSSAVALFVTGCSTQHINAGGTDPSAAPATITADSKVWSFVPIQGNFIGVTIDSVDGFKINAGTYKVSVDPGKHEIKVTCRAMGSEHTEKLDVDAVAGAHYKVYALVGGSDYCVSRLERKPEKS
jgi:hypothetical protein